MFLNFLIGAIREQRLRERETSRQHASCTQPGCSNAVHPAYAAAGDKCEDCFADGQRLYHGRDRSAAIV